MATLRLYQSTPYPCPYLPDRVAHHYISDPNFNLSTSAYSKLIDLGFRRAGERLHRPNCIQCSQCVSLRINVNDFSPSKSQRRILRKNVHLRVNIEKSPTQENYYQLYKRYIHARHPQTINMQNVEDTFTEFLFSSWSQTMAIEFRLPSNQLVCVSIYDPLEQGWSAVYTFFDTKYEKLSLGTYAILKQIGLLQQQNLSYLYLGYWIKDCRKMNYKTLFKPCEGFMQEQWKAIHE